MAYMPTNWATGDVITAEKLNHMENGIEALEVVLNITMDSLGVHVSNASSSISCQSIYNALNAGKRIIVNVNETTPNGPYSHYGKLFYSNYDNDEDAYFAQFSFDFKGGICLLTFKDNGNNIELDDSKIEGANINILRNSNDEIPVVAKELLPLLQTNNIYVTYYVDQNNFNSEKIISYSMQSGAYIFTTIGTSFRAENINDFPASGLT